MSVGGVIPCPGGEACRAHHTCPVCQGGGVLAQYGTTRTGWCGVCDGSGKVVYGPGALDRQPPAPLPSPRFADIDARLDTAIQQIRGAE